MGWLGVLEGARGHGLRRLVNLSSASAYGAAAFGPDPLDEDATRPDPTTLYSITKFAGERVAARLHELWQLDVLSVRLSSVFGPWERATGVRDTLSPPFQVMRAALHGAPVRLERADARDWVYAPDVARAIRALLVHPRPAHRLYNIAPGATWELSAWAARLAARHFAGLEVAIDPTAPTIASHMAQPRQPLRVERLRAEVGIGDFHGLEASADHYADWASRHRDLFDR
jgi:UDP-glucose 4-epimerase